MRGGRFQEKERSSEDGGSMRNAEMLFQTRSIADIREVLSATPPSLPPSGRPQCLLQPPPPPVLAALMGWLASASDPRFVLMTLRLPLLCHQASSSPWTQLVPLPWRVLQVEARTRKDIERRRRSCASWWGPATATCIESADSILAMTRQAVFLAARCWACSRFRPQPAPGPLLDSTLGTRTLCFVCMPPQVVRGCAGPCVIHGGTLLHSQSQHRVSKAHPKADRARKVSRSPASRSPHWSSRAMEQEQAAVRSGACACISSSS